MITLRSRTRTTLVLASSVAAAVLAGASPAQAQLPWIFTPPGNLALNALAVGTGVPCSLGSGPSNAVDGAASNIYTDKWCVRSGQARLLVTLSPLAPLGHSVTRMVVKHAGIAGENPVYNTRDFRIQTSFDAINWTPYATVFANTANVTSIDALANNVKFVQLIVDVPTQTRDPATRIYELEAWGRSPQ